MTVLQHVCSILGPNSCRLMARGDVSIYLWKDAESEGLAWIATIGMSSREQVVPRGCSCVSANPRTELLLSCYPADARILAEVLVDLSEYPFKNRRFIFWWQTVALGRKLSADSATEGFLLSMPPFPSEASTFHIGGKRIDLVWAIPLCGKELDYCRRNGIGCLEAELEKSGVDLANVRRGPIVA